MSRACRFFSPFCIAPPEIRQVCPGSGEVVVYSQGQFFCGRDTFVLYGVHAILMAKYLNIIPEYSRKS